MAYVHDVPRVSRPIKVRSSGVPGGKQTSVLIRSNRVKANFNAASLPPHPVALYLLFPKTQQFGYIYRFKMNSFIK
jgi:hypothetical protein